MAGSIQHNHPDDFSKLKCPQSAIICREKTIILGDVTIGAECVIHPTTRILARKGPIVIGSNNLIEERVTIINNFNEPMVIGNNNVFEVDSHFESRRMGNNNILECKSYVGPNIELTDNCIIGTGCRLSNNQEHIEEQSTAPALDQCEIFKPNTVVFGRDLNRRIIKDPPASSHFSQMDFLRKILPNYQKLWRPDDLPATPPTARPPR